MLMIRERVVATGRVDAELALPYESRVKHRFVARLSTGEEVGVALDRGLLLRHGECLRAEDGRVIGVVAAPEELLEVRSGDAAQLARIAFHLGNRHTRVQVGASWLRFPSDSVLRAMVQALGGEVATLEAPFDPEPGAYAGTHVHGTDTAPRSIIHDMIDRAGR